MTEISVLITYAQMRLINGHVAVSSRGRGLICGLSVLLYPYFMYVSSEGSCESVHMRKLAYELYIGLNKLKF